MPVKPLRSCLHHGCRELTRNTRCPEHTKICDDMRSKRASDNRADYHRWYSCVRWKALRLTWLKLYPLCVRCDKVNAATVVDHIVPHLGDATLFYDTSNLQSLCKRCHDIKTAAEDGGFNNQRK